MMSCKNLYLLCFLLSTFVVVQSRRHRLVLKNDHRDNILCSQFGFLVKGILTIKLEKLEFHGKANPTIGFTLDKATTTGIASYLETKSKKCVLTDNRIIDGKSLSVVYLTFDFKNKRLVVNRIGKDLKNLSIYLFEDRSKTANTSSKITTEKSKVEKNDSMSHLNGTEKAKKKKNIVTRSTHPRNNDSIPLKYEHGKYSTSLQVAMTREDDKGLYSLFFHNCDGQNTPVNMTLSLVEKNENSYLSAGRQPLPLVYFAFCGAYFILSWVWLVVLRTSKKDVFKIHYVMLALVFVKSIALLFHGVNNYVLGKEGIHEEGWAVMYYITYLMRGSLMLITLILIGAGWTYVKHMLHDREKKILLVGISLHALRFVANIIIDESEIGSARYTTWREIFILVDLLSVGLVLFPIVWSIRHLTKASRTDGKAAINLRRLKLFRHFYLLVICFIYTSRIIAYLLEITIPFTHTWLVELFREGATLIFFVITGYNFRPFNNNPYLLVPDVDLDEETEEIQMQHVISQSGYAEGTTRVNRSYKADDDSEIADASPDFKSDVERPPASSINQQVISHEED